MQMRDALTNHVVGGHERALRAERARHHRADPLDPQKIRANRSGRQIWQRLHVLAWRHQDVALEDRPGVEESNDLSVGQHDVRWHAPGGDIAEHAVADGTTFPLAGLAICPDDTVCTDDSLRGMAADGRRHILAIGGIGPAPDQDQSLPALIAHALALSGAAAPRVCALNTANGDDPASYVRMYARLSQHGARPSHLQLFPMPNVSDPEDLLLSQDVIFVGGGSVANMVATWRVHGLDEVMGKAWQAGIVLAGVSAGAICWFNGGTTDSFGRQLRPFTDGLGLLAGSYCPHYSAEPTRRPAYEGLVADGTLAAGIACDDGTGAHFADDDLIEIVADRAGAAAYRVEPDSSGGSTEETLPARLLD
jgi:peptidase E